MKGENMKKMKISAAEVLTICALAIIVPFFKLYEGVEQKFSLIKITDLARSFSERADLSYLSIVKGVVMGLTAVGAIFWAAALLIFILKKAQPNKAFFVTAAVSSFFMFLVELLPLFIGGIIEASIELYTQREIGTPKLFYLMTVLCAAAFVISVLNCRGRRDRIESDNSQ